MHKSSFDSKSKKVRQANKVASSQNHQSFSAHLNEILAHNEISNNVIFDNKLSSINGRKPLIVIPQRRCKSVPSPLFTNNSKATIQSYVKKSITTCFNKPNITQTNPEVHSHITHDNFISPEERSLEQPKINSSKYKSVAKSSEKPESEQITESSAVPYGWPKNYPIICPIILPCQFCHASPYGYPPQFAGNYPMYGAPEQRHYKEHDKSAEHEGDQNKGNLQLKIKLMNTETENNALKEKIKEVKAAIKGIEEGEKHLDKPHTREFKLKAENINRYLTEYKGQEERLFQEKEYILKILNVII